MPAIISCHVTKDAFDKWVHNPYAMLRKKFKKEKNRMHLLLLPSVAMRLYLTVKKTTCTTTTFQAIFALVSATGKIIYV